ncbi:hypothetical protein F4604DRAFT_1094748 [Suillus subluteus]|nr:hypothetical protein F4604DRAFT_1094748 [Suillus subluteus]
MYVGLGTVPQYWILLLYWLLALSCDEDSSGSLYSANSSLGGTKAIVEVASPIEGATKWFGAFVDAVRTSDIASTVDLFHETGSWSDHVIALT